MTTIKGTFGTGASAIFDNYNVSDVFQEKLP